jgi:hypothetical protein
MWWLGGCGKKETLAGEHGPALDLPVVRDAEMNSPMRMISLIARLFPPGLCRSVAVGFLGLGVCLSSAGTPFEVAPVPVEIAEAFQLKPFYTKHASVHGFPVLGSDKVSDYALLEAAHLVNRLLDGRDDIRGAMITNQVRLAVMAYNEFTTDIPEHGDLEPAGFWDRRARGLGATRRRPAVSCGEENLLGYPGDPYRAENILIHEFAHAIHEMGLNTVDPSFDRRLKEIYDKAIAAGLWKGTYAAVSRGEYWAEGVQSWFDCNRENDNSHNHVNTREELKDYDPALAELIKEVFGDRPWRYRRPELRAESETSHLAGFNPAGAPMFKWRPDAVAGSGSESISASP